MLNLIHIDSGEIKYFGKPLLENEVDIKKRIEYLTGTVNWYPRKKIKDIANVVSRFYDTSDEEIIDYLQTKSTNFSEMFSKYSPKKFKIKQSR